MHCSKGTYIRSLAEDIGHELGCGATVKALRRLQAGEFHIAQAMTLGQLQELDERALTETLMAVDAPLQTIPAVYLDGAQAQSVKFGQALDFEETLLGSVRMYTSTEFLGLGEMRLDGKLTPKKLFNLNG